MENATPHNFDKLDYTIHDIKERNALVAKICQQYKEAGIEINQNYLQVMSDYCLNLDVKKEYKDKSILTKNRMATIYKRETSYESLEESLPGGENDLYNMILDNPGEIYLTKHQTITKEDLMRIPELVAILEAIEDLKEEAKTAVGKRLYLLKKTIIEKQEELYLIKTLKTENNIGLICPTRSPKDMHYLQITGELYEDCEGNIHSTDKINLADPEHVNIVLHHYSKIRQDTCDMLNADLKWLIFDLDNLIETYVKDQKPVWYDIIIKKIDGVSNEEIAAYLKEKHNVELSVNTISTLWCNSIPKLIAEGMEKVNTRFYYKEHNMPFKVCSKCGRKLPAHNLFFHTNNKSADHLYSICKDCRKQ